MVLGTFRYTYECVQLEARYQVKLCRCGEEEDPTVDDDDEKMGLVWLGWKQLNGTSYNWYSMYIN